MLSLSTSGAPVPLDYHGTRDFPLTERIASDIQCHGLAWAHSYHISRGLPAWEWDVLSSHARSTLPNGEHLS